MKAKETTENSILLKKYLVKRRHLREQPVMGNSSIFEGSRDNQMSTFTEKDPFKKYQTLTTNIQNSISLHENNEDITSTHLKTQRQYTQEMLPKINISSKYSLANPYPLNHEQSLMPIIKLRNKELSHHQSDPVYIKLQKTISRRVQEKFSKYKRGWMNSCTKRKSKSILERSAEKVSQMIQSVNADAGRRKNTTLLQEMLRNNIKQKTFIFPGSVKPSIQGLKGRGGKAISMFEQIFISQQVFKKHPQ